MTMHEDEEEELILELDDKGPATQCPRLLIQASHLLVAWCEGLILFGI